MRRFMLGIAFAATSFMPAIGMADDQQIADFIKSRLLAHQQQGQLKGFNVDMTVEKGVVWFKGHVSSASQEEMILSTAQQAGHLGVVQVVDDIEVVDNMNTNMSYNMMEHASPLQTASYQQPSPQYSQPAVPMQQPMPQTMQGVSYRRPEMSGPAMPGAGMPMAFAESSARARQDLGGVVEQPVGNYYGGAADPNCPVPMGGAGYGGGGMGAGSPNLPGYAWPGYAAHPNYGQVNYPKQYSASAWPYIGPFYPYPQVPLGWRKVSLQWDDGWWWLDFDDKGGRRR